MKLASSASCLLLSGLSMVVPPFRAELPTTPVAPPEFTIVLRPACGTAPEVTAIAVRETISGSLPADGQPIDLLASTVFYGIIVADRIKQFTLTDARGAVPYHTTDDSLAQRHWQPERPISFPLIVTYTTLVQPKGAPGGSPMGMHVSNGGVSGAGITFLVLPQNTRTTTTRLQWDLRELAPGSLGVSSFGQGTVVVAGAPERLTKSWLLVGPAQQYAPPQSLRRSAPIG